MEKVIHVYRDNEERRHCLMAPFACFCEPEVQVVFNRDNNIKTRVVVHQALDEIPLNGKVKIVRCA